MCSISHSRTPPRTNLISPYSSNFLMGHFSQGKSGKSYMDIRTFRQLTNVGFEFLEYEHFTTKFGKDINFLEY